ncbi:MAG: hypothetical protein U5L09_11385 [Bacteroidales bacterium]|nr:hypothetical protein [Bacteroidales bacterium]
MVQNKKKRANDANKNISRRALFLPFMLLNAVFPTGIAERQRGSGGRNLYSFENLKMNKFENGKS